MKSLFVILLSANLIFAQAVPSATATTDASGNPVYTPIASTKAGVYTQMCSVTDPAYGAVGNGSTDDTAAINLALAACLYVYFPTPSVCYKTTSPLMARSNNILFGGSGGVSGSNGGSYICAYGTGHGIAASFLPEGQYSSGGTHTGTGTCTVTFLGGGGGTATIAVTAGAIAAGTAFTAFSGGVYNPAPTTATLSGGTGSAACAGTANVFITAPGAGTRGLSFWNLYVEDDYGSRSAAANNGDALYIDGGTDAAIFTLFNFHTYKFVNSFTPISTINSFIGGHSRFNSALVNGVNQSGASTLLNVDGLYVDAPGQDCADLSNMVGGVWAWNCDSPGRDNVHMDSAVPPQGITFHPETEAVSRYAFYLEGQSHIIEGGTCYVVDVNWTVTTSGTAVVRSTGPVFTQALVGSTISVNGTIGESNRANYTVASVTDGTNLVLSGAGAGTNASPVASFWDNGCIYADNVSQIEIHATSTRNGLAGLIYKGGGTKEAAFPNVVSYTMAGNYTSGSNSTNAQGIWDPNAIVKFPDVTYRCLASASGTAPTCANPWPIFGFRPGQVLTAHIQTPSSSTAPTINFDGQGAVTIQKNGLALALGDLAAGSEVSMQYYYNGSSNTFQLITPPAMDVYEIAKSDLTSQTSALTTSALFTPAVTGSYRVSYYAKVTTPGTSSILGGTTGFVLHYTDGTDSVAQNLTFTESNQAGTILSIGTGDVTNTTAALIYGSAMVYAKTGVAMTFDLGYSSTGTAMQYEVHVRVEAN